MNAPLTKNQLAGLMSDSLTFRSASFERTDAPSSIWQTMKLALSTSLTKLRDLPRRRAVLNELYTLTDRELADIGLQRSELGRVFDPNFAEARRAVN